MSRPRAISEAPELVSRQEQALRYLDLVWAEQQGFGCWAVGRQGRFVGEGYEFSEGLSQRFEAWPPADESHRASLARRLVQASNVTDIFVAPLVRSSSVRVKGSGLPGQFLYADLDRPRTPEQDQLLTRLLGEGDHFAFTRDATSTSTSKSSNYSLSRCSPTTTDA